jgi:hypothetical protein
VDSGKIDQFTTTHFSFGKILPCLRVARLVWPVRTEGVSLADTGDMPGLIGIRSGRTVAGALLHPLRAFSARFWI